MKLKTPFRFIVLCMALLMGGVPNLLHSAESLLNGNGEFDWVPIPEGAEVAPLIEQEIRRLA